MKLISILIKEGRRNKIYYIDYYKSDQKEDNFDYIKKTLLEIMKIKAALHKTNNYRSTLSDIVHYYMQNILKYKNITKVDVSDFIWINYIENNMVSPNMLAHFLVLMFKVLLFKNSIEKIGKKVYNHYMKLTF